MLKLHDLRPAEGSTRPPKRVGRGIGGKGGKTAGRGTKGAKARSKVPIWYEGGQLPIQQRLPKKRGFTNPFRVSYQPINLDTIEVSGLDEVTPDTLREAGLLHHKALVKVLGRGELSRAVHRARPRRLGVRRSRHHRGRWHRAAPPTALRRTPSSRPGQPAHQPLVGSSRAPPPGLPAGADDLRSNGALELSQHLQDPQLSGRSSSRCNE